MLDLGRLEHAVKMANVTFAVHSCQELRSLGEHLGMKVHSRTRRKTILRYLAESVLAEQQNKEETQRDGRGRSSFEG